MDKDRGTDEAEKVKTHNVIELRPIELSGRQNISLLYGGLLFLFASFGCFGAIVWWSTQYAFKGYYSEEKIGYSLVELVNYFLPILFNPLLLLVAALICARVGYSMLKAAGAVGRDVIPRQDYELLSKLMADEKEKSIDLYIRLNSLTGATGVFTKLGISGLPLATIFLTLVFSLLGFSSENTKLLDFANLTLGAFLGSYVQKKAIGKNDGQVV